MGPHYSSGTPGTPSLNSAAMKLFILLAAVAIATTEGGGPPPPDAAEKAVVKSAPIAHVPGTPTITGLASTFPTLKTSGYFPIIYPGHNSFSPLWYWSGTRNLGSPIFYWNTAGQRFFSPIIYTSGTTSTISSPAVVPKYFAETEGSQHIVN